MKKVLFILLVTGILISCSSDETTDNYDYFEVWQLTKMTGSFEGSETTGINMEWQETYKLNANGSFKKVRVVDELLIEKTGVYIYKNLNEQNVIEFTYEEANSIIGNCTGDLKEVLLIIEEGSKLKGTWQACDGPGLEYEQMFFCGTN